MLFPLRPLLSHCFVLSPAWTLLICAATCLLVSSFGSIHAEIMHHCVLYTSEAYSVEGLHSAASSYCHYSFDAHPHSFAVSPQFSGLHFLHLRQAVYYQEHAQEYCYENYQRQHTAHFISSTTDVVHSTTSNSTHLSTSATRTSTSSAASIPLLSEAFVDVPAFADSLGIRLGNALGAKSNRGVEGIPYTSGKGYTFQATPDLATPYSTNAAIPAINQGNSARRRTTNSPTDPFTVNVRENLLGTPLRTGIQTYTLDEYLTARKEYLRLGLQDSIMHHYEFRKPLQAELASILMQSANVSIPFPNNPLNTIFGKPELRLNANIEFNIRLGLGYNASRLNVASATGQGQVYPIFTQNIQSNISAGIGDKFSISLDNNTMRQFEFDNLLRFAYDGEPDEIFRRIEVGNVTLNSASTFISGSQALFGARLDLQFGPVFLKILGAQRRGQRKVSSIKGGAVKQPILIRAYDYADNNFFINVRHRGVWQRYAQTAPEFPNATQFNGVDSVSILRVKEIEVWESTPDLRTQESAEAVVVAQIDSLVGANAVYPKDKYASDVTDPTRVGELERGRFVRLPESRFVYDPNLGRLTILQLRKDRTYGIAYRLEGATPSDNDDQVFGTFVRNVSFTRGSDTVGGGGLIGTGDSLVRLQMVYRPNIQPGFKKLWERQMLNIYNIGAQQVSTKDTKIDIVYLPQSGGVESPNLPAETGFTDKLVTILKVDRVNNSGAGAPDGLLDMHLPFIFNPQRGEIVFPSLEPFRDGIRRYFLEKSKPLEEADKYTYGDVYDTTRDAARMNAARDRFMITGEVSGSAGNRIQLPNAFNLAPGSVKVTLNNKVLTEYTDYRVEYFTGVVELSNPEATLPSANLEIEYEQNDVFQIANKTMFGVRLDLDTKPLLRSRHITADIGITAMNYSQQIITERIRLGEEPMNNTMLGADGKISWNADWLTKALDWLPFYNTKTPSSITASGEVAWMLPIPNNRPSDVLSDNFKPAVYIDDFEAVQRTYSLGRQYAQWRHASPPTPDASGNFVGMSLQDIAHHRAAMRWYQFFIGRVPVEEIYPNRSVIRGGQLANSNELTLEIYFNPNERGIYNTNPRYLDSITYITPGNEELLRGRTPEAAYQADKDTLFFNTSARRNIWGGFMRLLSPFNTNFDNDNIEYLEIVMRVNEMERDSSNAIQTKMFVDIGQVSEDVIPNGQLDTEDGILPGKEVPNGMIANDEQGEDVGLDGLSNELERAAILTDTTGVPPVIQRKGPISNARNPNPFIRREADPSRDDFRFPRIGVLPEFLHDSDFVRYNGYEGNATADAGKFPDTEILNPNNGQTLMRADAFFRYEVNLNPNPQQNPQIINKSILNGRETGFITYRIPIRQNFIRVGDPLFTNIQYVRVWWKGGVFRGQIADWRFVGSQWIRQPALLPTQPPSVDTTLQIGFVGIEENSGSPEFYTLPPGVNRQTQLTNPDPNQRVLQNEQSLALRSINLRPGQEHAAARFFRPFDVFFYKQLKIFFHGRGNELAAPGVRVEDRKKHLAFIRFGVDTLNYYEYNTVLHQGWQEVAIDLAKLTSLKGEQDIEQALRSFGKAAKIDPENPEGEFIIKGVPTLTRLQYVAVGIRNQSVATDTVVQLWANELRVIDPDVNPSRGFAAVGNLTTKLADLGTITATVNMQNAYFHRLEERFGNRNDRTSLNITSQLAFERFFPESWAGTSLPLSYIYSRTLDQPRFLPQNDVVAETAAIGEAGRFFPEREAERRAYQQFLIAASETEVIEQQIALTGVRLNIPIPFFLFSDIFNQFIFNFAYSNREERSPIFAYKYGFNWRFQLQYAKNFSQIPIRPFFWTDSIPLLNALKEWTLFLLPNTFSFSFESNRSRQSEVLRAFLSERRDPDTKLPVLVPYIMQPRSWLEQFYMRTDTVLTPQMDTIFSPVIRTFDASRQVQMSWKLEENGFLNPTMDLAINTYGTMLGFETDPVPTPDGRQRQRSDAEVFQHVFPGWLDENNSFRFPLDLGIDTRHSQNFTLNFRPRLPAFMGGNRFIIPTGRYTALYGWERIFNGASDVFSALNKVARNETTLNGALAFRLRDLVNTLLPQQSQLQSTSPLQSLQPIDAASGSTTLAAPQVNDDDLAKQIVRIIRAALFWEQAGFTIQRTSAAQNAGLLGTEVGGTGFASIISSVASLFDPAQYDNSERFGPSAWYQLGLVNEPHHQLRFNNPFSAATAGQPLFAAEPGRRPVNAALPDMFKENITLELRLQRELWQGATLELNSGGRYEYSRTQTLLTSETNPFGEATNRIEYFKYDRTFISFLPFEEPLERVNRFYQEYSRNLSLDPEIRRSQQISALNNAFVDGLESFSSFNTNDGERQARKVFLPLAINWAFRWNGLEQFAPLRGILRSGTLEHRYVSRYSSTERLMQGAERVLDMQSVSVSWEPLLAITAQFDDKFVDGVMTGTFRWNDKTQYGIASSNPTLISKEATIDRSLQITYTRRGFQLPKIPGLDLLKLVGTEVKVENDIEFGLQATWRTQNRSAIDIGRNETINPGGRRIDGSEKILIEPSARYTFSKQLTVRAFVSYDANLSEGAATPGSEVWQLGVDIRLTLTGGRNF